MRSYRCCLFFFLSEEGTSQSLFYEVGDNEHYNMAIEDGLFPLAYVTHTIKYLQQCKFS